MPVKKTPRPKSAPEPAKPAKARARKQPLQEAQEAPEAKPAVRKAAKAAKAAPAQAPEPAEKPARKGKAPEVPAATPEPAIPKASPRKKTAAVASPLPPFAEAVLAAIREGRALEFIFADADANAPRTFEPRQLAFDTLSQAWYVWGWDRRYNAERYHRLDLLAEVNPVEGVGRAAQGPYAEGTPANQIGGWLGGEPIAVKATLLKQWVFAVKQAPPAFPHFHLEETGDGQATVSFTATDLRAIARWVFQFGDGIQVLEPARLLDRMRQVGAAWTGRDRQPAPAPAPSESRPAPRPEPSFEPRRPEPRPAREERPRDTDEQAAKHKPGKVEVIRFDRL